MFRKVRVVSSAMKALKETVDDVPVDDTYFPTPSVMKATLSEMYESLCKESQAQDFAGMAIDCSARLLLVRAADAFELAPPRPTMAAWCRAASETLGPCPRTRFDAGYSAASPTGRQESVFAYDQHAPASEIEKERIVRVRVPQLPKSIDEAVVGDWLKQVGETVAREENLVDLETDKVVLEVPSQVNGTITKIQANTGDTVIADQILAFVAEK